MGCWVMLKVLGEVVYAFSFVARPFYFLSIFCNLRASYVLRDPTFWGVGGGLCLGYMLLIWYSLG